MGKAGQAALGACRPDRGMPRSRPGSRAAPWAERRVQAAGAARVGGRGGAAGVSRWVRTGSSSETGCGR